MGFEVLRIWLNEGLRLGLGRDLGLVRVRVSPSGLGISVWVNLCGPVGLCNVCSIIFMKENREEKI